MDNERFRAKPAAWSTARRHLWRALAAAWLWAAAGPSPAAEFELTTDEQQRVEDGETVIRAKLDSSQRRGTVRAALIIEAPADVVFTAMTRCEDALQYVPHLRRCRMLPTNEGPQVRMVEHVIDLGWYAPRMRYVFRADLVDDRRIEFRQVDGDFKVNHGAWEFEPQGPDAGRTLVRYRVEIDPPAYVPSWLARSMFRRELPAMLAGLRRHCEARPGSSLPWHHPAARANILAE